MDIPSTLLDPWLNLQDKIYEGVSVEAFAESVWGISSDADYQVAYESLEEDTIEPEEGFGKLQDALIKDIEKATNLVGTYRNDSEPPASHMFSRSLTTAPFIYVFKKPTRCLPGDSGHPSSDRLLTHPREPALEPCERKLPPSTPRSRVITTSPTASGKRKRSPSPTFSTAKRVRCHQPYVLTKNESRLASAAMESISASSRHYTIGVYVNKFIVSLWYYDRTCVIRTVDFDFKESPQRFALICYALTNRDSRHGFDPFLFRSSPSKHPSDNCAGGTAGAQMVFPSVLPDRPTTHFRIDEKPLYLYHGLLGRGTAVYQASRYLAEDRWESGIALKLSWPNTARPTEATIINKLRCSIPEWRDHLPNVEFSETYTAEYLSLPRIRLLPPDFARVFEDRRLHVLAMDMYKKLWEVDNIKEFQDVFVDCVQCHYHAFKTGRVLHRDLSVNNLMFQRRGNTAKGIVNDWDMALIIADDEDFAQISPSPAGTLPFMAIDLLDETPPTHLYRHDLESLFYILVWAAVHFDIKKKRRLSTHGCLSTWLNSTYRVAMNAKYAFFSTEDSSSRVRHEIREEFVPVWNQWIIPLRKLFADAIADGFQHWESEVYNMRTYGGRITFDSFMGVLKQEPRQAKLPSSPDGFAIIQAGCGSVIDQRRLSLVNIH